MHQPLSRLERLLGDFADLRVSVDAPGFYDHSRFLAAEKAHPDLLNDYAEFVLLRPYSDAYLDKARREISLIVELVRRELVIDGRLGACIDVAMIISRILERENYWNFIAKGSLTLTFPPKSGITAKHFYSFDLVPKGVKKFAAGHAWLCAPPFQIIDVSVKQQPLAEGRNCLPDLVLTEEARKVDAKAEEVFSPEFRQAFSYQEQIPIVLVPRFAAPGWREFVGHFPAREIVVSEVTLTYTPVGIGAPDTSFESMNNWRINARLGKEIYSELIEPELVRLRVERG